MCLVASSMMTFYAATYLNYVGRLTTTFLSTHGDIRVQRQVQNRMINDNTIFVLQVALKTFLVVIRRFDGCRS
jgi:hypothetical protein